MAKFKAGDKVKRMGDPNFAWYRVATPFMSKLWGTCYWVERKDKNGELVKTWFMESQLVPVNAVRNARSRNAKFKVGDEVRVGNPHHADRGRYGKVVSAGVDGNPLLYDVDLGGGVQLFSESDLVAANSRSRNAVVQKALNAVARNGKSYPFYVVEKAMKGKCIFSGRYELSDANDDVAELKKSGVESKAVPRRVLLMSGIDPDEESSWKKNHKKD